MSQAAVEAGERSARSLCLPPKPIQTNHDPHQDYPLQNVEHGDAMMPPLKKGTQATTPWPQQRTLPNELGKYIM